MFGAVFAVGVAVMTRGARLQAAGPAVETLVSPRPVGRARSRAGDTAAGRRKAQTRDGEEEKKGERDGEEVGHRFLPLSPMTG